VPTINRGFIWEGEDAASDLSYGSAVLLSLRCNCKAALSIKPCPSAERALGSAILAPSEKYSEIYFPASFSRAWVA